MTSVLKVAKALAGLAPEERKEAVAFAKELARQGTAVAAPEKRTYKRRKKGAKPGPKPGSRRKPKEEPLEEEVEEAQEDEAEEAEE